MMADAPEADPTVDAQSNEFLELLKPVVQKFVRTRVVEYGRDAIPVCGLYGDERDSTYTDMTSEFHSLPEQINKNIWQQPAYEPPRCHR